MNATLRALAPITLLLAAALAAAEPFNPALVAADARWVAHIDVDHARHTEGLRRLLTAHFGEPDLQRLQGRWDVQLAGLDRDAFSFICAYGSGDGHSETAIIGAAPATADWFASWMSRVGQPESDQQIEGWLIRSWRRHGRLTAMTTIELPAPGAPPGAHPGAPPGDPPAPPDAARVAIVLADSIEEVVAGARVATGAAPSLADTEDPALHARPAPGSIVFLAAEGIDQFKGLRPRAVALREAERLTLDFGEAGGRMFLEAAITAAGPEQALATRDLLSGLRAWGRMAIAQSDRASQCAPLLDAFALSVEGPVVSVSWSADVAALPVPPAPPEAPPTAQDPPAQAPPASDR